MKTVSDIMAVNVLTVPPEMPVVELVRTLADAQVSGVPVVGDDGRVVGVVSATDVLRYAADGFAISREESPDEKGAPSEESGDDEADLQSFFLSLDIPTAAAEADLVTFEGDPDDGPAVREIMTPAAFSIEADASIEELAEFLVRGRIHRAVVESEGRFVGIVTAFDVLRGLAAPSLG